MTDDLIPPKLIGDPVATRHDDKSTCSVGTWYMADECEYQWYVDGIAVAGATSATYAPGQDDGIVKCEVTARNAAGATSARSTAIFLK